MSLGQSLSVLLQSFATLKVQKNIGGAIQGLKISRSEFCDAATILDRRGPTALPYSAFLRRTSYVVLELYLIR
jgi:hypothetical protein